MTAAHSIAATTAKDMALSRSQTAHFIAAPENVPISFVYDGHVVHGIPATWAPVSHKRRIDATIIETVFQGRDTATGLQIKVECLEYLDYPVVEWTAWLTNTGATPTPLIENLQALDGSFTGASAVLSHCNGDFYSEDGYTPQDTPLPTGATFACAPHGGRACDGAFPYFRLAFDGNGLTLAVGWPGQWSASFTGTEMGVAVTAGQELTHLRLLPGETIRTPRITLLSWTGDTDRAVNLWRRWYRAHLLPRPNGQPLAPLLTAAATDDGEEFTAATEENQIRYIDKFAEAGFDFDVWWIDAGWYPCYNENHERKWGLTGTWEPDPERFPHGLRPISVQASRHNAAFLLWFEPERVAPNTWLDREHPEWILRTPRTEEPFTRWSLLNLGDPTCRQWVTDHYCTIIQDQGIKIYRQDFNFPPLRYWRENDSEDRQGITENLHIQGYLQFWDDLLARNPGLWIDSCSSGGRRNDLETMRRSVPLHYTDYGYGIHPVKLAFHHTLFAWIPYFKESTLSWDVLAAGEDTRFDRQIDSFSFHCGLAAMLSPAIDIRKDNNDIATALKMIGIWRRASTLLLHGDYYPFTPFSKSPDRWVVWQFDNPDMGVGFVQGIRHTECPEERMTVHLKALRPDTVYILDNPETGATRELSGATLANEGFTFELAPRNGAIWFYREKTQ